MKTRRIKVDPEHPQPHLLKEGVAVLLQGGVVAFPTDTSYGLGVNPFDDKAVARLYKIKKRDPQKPLIILINDKKQIGDLAAEVSAAAAVLMEECWPNPLTLIFKISDELRNFTIGNMGKIGVRIPLAPLSHKLIELAKIPITATSANISGEPSSFSADEVLGYFADEIDLIIDDSKTLSRKESTVVDVSVTPPQLIREGAIPVAQLKTLIGELQPC